MTSFLPSFLASYLPFLPPPILSFPWFHPVFLFYAIKHPSILFGGFNFIYFLPFAACSDKELLSQTRTLAMSFVKCASTDTEHQYKLVKDISF